MTTETEPEIYLNEIEHRYFHKSGRELMAVTKALELIGITDFSRVPFEVLEPARLRGDAVHQMAAYHGHGILDESSVDPDLAGYLIAIKKYYADHVKHIVAIEEPVYSVKFGYAGTLDLIHEDNEGRFYLEDFKTPIKVHVATRWQCAAYAYAYEKMHDVKISFRSGVHLRADGTYEIVPYKNTLRRDFDEFLSILKVAIIKVENKIK